MNVLRKLIQTNYPIGINYAGIAIDEKFKHYAFNCPQDTPVLTTILKEKL